MVAQPPFVDLGHPGDADGRMDKSMNLKIGFRRRRLLAAQVEAGGGIAYMGGDGAEATGLLESSSYSLYDGLRWNKGGGGQSSHSRVTPKVVGVSPTVDEDAEVALRPGQHDDDGNDGDGGERSRTDMYRDRRRKLMSAERSHFMPSLTTVLANSVPRHPPINDDDGAGVVGQERTGSLRKGEAAEAYLGETRWWRAYQR